MNIGPITILTPSRSSSLAAIRVFIGSFFVSFGNISILELLILFIANLTDNIIDLPISLCFPDSGINKPIFIFSSAYKFCVLIGVTKIKKVIILINIIFPKLNHGKKFDEEVKKLKNPNVTWPYFNRFQAVEDEIQNQIKISHDHPQRLTELMKARKELYQEKAQKMEAKIAD